MLPDTFGVSPHYPNQVRDNADLFVFISYRFGRSFIFATVLRSLTALTDRLVSKANIVETAL